MTIYLENLQELPLPFDPEQTAKAVAECALDMEQCPYEAEVSVTLVDDEVIRKLNRAHRGIDAATDVLSFPLVPFPSPAEYGFLETADDCFDPETGFLVLGDIVISVGRAAEQAAAYGHSLYREFSFLIAHSMLHLLGYDHMEPEEAAVMEKRQEDILQKLSITRDCQDA